MIALYLITNLFLIDLTPPGTKFKWSSEVHGIVI